MKVRYTYKLRPGKRAVSLLLRNFGMCRWLWNKSVELFNNRGETGQVSLMQGLTTLRNDDETSWLREGSAVCQQQMLRDFIATKKAFFDGRCGRPRFKTKYRTRPSLNYTKRSFRITPDNKLKLAGGIVIPVVWSRPLPDEPSSVRVYQDAAGWWFCSFVVEVEEKHKKRDRDGHIGIDWGVKTPATTTQNDLDLGYTPRVKDNAKNLAKYQRRMAKHRKSKQWENYRKAKNKAAKLQRKVRNQRKEQTRKWAQNVARNNKIVAAENLTVEFMKRNHHLAKKVSDISIGMLKDELKQACKDFDCEFILVDPMYTTMDCSRCGARPTATIELNVRTYHCPSCGLVMDRDKNAAWNMLKRAGFNPTSSDGYNPSLVPLHGQETFT